MHRNLFDGSVDSVAVGPDGTVFVVFSADYETLLAVSPYNGSVLWRKYLGTFEDFIPYCPIAFVRNDGIVGLVDFYLTDWMGSFLVTHTHELYLVNVRLLAALPDNSMILFTMNSTLELRAPDATTVIWSTLLDYWAEVQTITVDGAGLFILSVAFVLHFLISAGVVFVVQSYVNWLTIHALSLENGQFLWTKQFNDTSPTGKVVIADNSTFLFGAGFELFSVGCCSSHGNCSSIGRCSCEANYHGEDCGVYCDNTTCKYVHAICSVENGSCICADNYFGSTCDIFCDEKITCNSHGVCSSTGHCKCTSPDEWGLGGYKGENCSEKQIPWILIGFSVGGGIFLILCLVVIVVKRIKNKRSGYQSIQ